MWLTKLHLLWERELRHHLLVRRSLHHQYRITEFYWISIRFLYPHAFGNILAQVFSSSWFPNITVCLHSYSRSAFYRTARSHRKRLCNGVHSASWVQLRSHLIENSGSCLENREDCCRDVGIRHADHVAPSIRKSWQSLRRQAAVARSV
jgi:hypothetical protein